MTFKKGYGCAFGGGTIINAIAAWKGCAYATQLKTYAEVCLSDAPTCSVSGSIYENPTADTRLIELCVQSVLDLFDCPAEATVLTKSEIPIAGGLKSSSAAANATLIATLDALGEKLSADEIVQLGVKAAKEAGVTITGAYDDACASFYGGVAVTDNKTMELLQRDEFHYNVLILNPETKAFSAETNVSRSVLMKDLVETAFEIALTGDYKKAMKLNGLIYCGALGFDPAPAVACMEIGEKFDVAAGLSGTGPSFTALLPCSDLLSKDEQKELQTAVLKIKQIWAAQFPGGKIYETKTCNLNALDESRRFSKYMKNGNRDLKEFNFAFND
ncbi:shikimate kinase [Methanimicrococcus blatticola]|uniref:Shikimate kinase n=1 Tax=Methanimicrococcus blatticola TaxID=91560 RepID=A0A484F6G8_9EURY|nr:shikimate kinase [Methanimicrococcus blatticola]MBZ3935887.1 shikimate kinase [Methanimicrococcus blatticola]MCC2509062.1 shikimate kinase [Methanimicrococcus blatticola]TDQ68377.1 shikimate kinase [Methanimicrococcus blatticola]